MYFDKEGIVLESFTVKIIYKGVQHALRDKKNPLQKVTVPQLKRIGKIVNDNNVYCYVTHSNIVFIQELSNEEVIDHRNWIKIPINIGKQNIVGTVSRIPQETITKSPKIYKKID